ncbi:chlorophyll synthesis pathway [Lecanosticta acicola]|uniref:Chlorophyll synthesis pathway n=1 Tax=Lecanosticta acicola TaxID=111012 RepID=A0AAI8YTN9_9PEZI|nr:chlorophyll synthesis pathway [Lecanosticta acicola]
MKAARFYGQGDIRIDEVPEPIAKHGQVLVDVAWCGICGSDLHEYLIGPVILPTPERPNLITGVHIPLTLGHELCGTVRDPPSSSRFKNGDQVMVNPLVECKSCLACKSGSTQCCAQLGIIGGSTGFGGFGQVVAVDEDKIMLLPPGIPLDFAAVVEPLAVVQHAIKVSGIDHWKDKDVLVVGGGPVGFAMLLCLRAWGAEKVVVSEPAALRKQQCSGFARAVIDPMKEDVGVRCRELTGGKGIDVVFDCAGVAMALQSAIGAMRFESLYVMVAVWEGLINVPCWPFLGKHITMKGSLVYDDSAMQEVMSLIVEGKLNGWREMVTGRIGLDGIVGDGFRELIDHKEKHIKILVNPQA